MHQNIENSSWIAWVDLAQVSSVLQEDQQQAISFCIQNEFIYAILIVRLLNIAMPFNAFVLFHLAILVYILHRDENNQYICSYYCESIFSITFVY